MGQFANEAESVGQSPPSAMTEKAPPRTDPPTPPGGRWINETGLVGQSLHSALTEIVPPTRRDPPTFLRRVGGSVWEGNRIGGSVFAAEDEGNSATAR